MCNLCHSFPLSPPTPCKTGRFVGRNLFSQPTGPHIATLHNSRRAPAGALPIAEL
ncbi:hypothetical protein HMPREF9069_01921 [Atopobium sp. oral taxon 810 str. F0209]|nr:hypothetical protein HMPREF9069_01921 [Atopobium sp. oral taxon 810 str. F0209]